MYMCNRHPPNFVTIFLRSCLAWRYTGVDTETLKGHILTFFGRSECNYAVSLCMLCMCLSIGKYHRYFQLFQDKKKNALFHPLCFLFHHTPCPVCESVCEMPLTHIWRVRLRLRWLTEKKWILFNYFILSSFFPFPPSLCLTFCLSKRAPLCACVRARFARACMDVCWMSLS